MIYRVVRSRHGVCHRDRRVRATVARPSHPTHIGDVFRVSEIVDEQRDGYAERMRPTGYQFAKHPFLGRFFIDMEWLWIELGCELYNLYLWYRVVICLVYFANP